jgi:HK97 family phage major capsid protein
MAKQLTTRQIERLLGKKLKRALPVERDQIVYDDEAQTIEMSFSSDAEIEHWFGRLRLNHDPKCIRMDRIRAGGPFLCDHDRTKLAGVHESFDTDGSRTHGTIRFSKNTTLGRETYADIRDGIRPNVSIGLRVYELHLLRDDDDGPVYESDDWEPTENSSVTCAADTSIGVGRAADSDEDCGGCGEADCEVCNPSGGNDGEEEQGREVADEIAARAREAELLRRAGMDPAQPPNTEARSTMERDEELLRLAEAFGDAEIVRDFLADETKTVKDYRAAVKAQRAAARAQTPPPPAEDPSVVASRQGGPVQIVRGAFGRLKNFRGERAREEAYRFGMFMLAGPMSRAIADGNPGLLKRAQDFCRSNGIAITRAHSESDNESGGFLVPTEFEAVMIDLREKYGIFRQFANVVPMSSDSKQRPRRKGGLKAYPIGAKGGTRKITESKKKWDLVELFARKWGVLAKYEDELSEDAVVSFADDMAGEIAYAFTVAEDEAGFIGDGTGDYHGILGLFPKLLSLSGTKANIAGLVIASGNNWDAITRADMLKVVGRLPQYADTPNARWFCSKTFWAEVMVRIILEAGGVTAAEVEGARVKSFLGYQVEIAQVLPKATGSGQIPCGFGDLAKAAMLGDRRGVTVKLTDSNDTDFEEDLWTIKGTERFDINVHDVGNASGTAADREPGPMVALITQ